MPINVFELLSRAGYVARGIVFILIGALAFFAAFTPGGSVEGSRGALRVLLEQPLGWLWLAAVSAGLAIFSGWRMIQALFDPDRLGTSWRMLGWRGGYGISSVLYLGLAIYAASLALGFATQGENQAVQAWTFWLMQQPFGPWLVMALGAGTACVSCGWLWQAWTGERALMFLEKPASKWSWTAMLGRIGFVSISIMFGLIGAFLITAGYYGRSSEAQGMGGVLAILESQPLAGALLLGLTALGLVSFGMFSILLAVFRHIQPPATRNLNP